MNDSTVVLYTPADIRFCCAWDACCMPARTEEYTVKALAINVSLIPKHSRALKSNSMQQ